MAKFQVLIEPINATPKTYPYDQLVKLFPALKKHLERDVGPMLKKDMEKTVENWNTKPDMVVEVTQPSGTRLQLTVQPKGKGTTNWKRISEGTGPRIIRAKKPKGMSFQSKYDPKTTPSGRYGGPGRKYGPWRRGVKSVRHTIKPRKFAVRIMKRREKGIRSGIQGVVRKASKL